MAFRDELLPPMIEAVVVVLREMAGVEAIPRDGAGVPAADLSAVIRLTAETEGRLALALPSATAAAIARRVLRDLGGAPDEGMIRDCAGEVANVIAGQAKTLLLGTRYHFTFSLPKVVTGSEVRPGDPRGEWLVAAFDSDAGPFALRLGFEV